jgi:hypothetical protein
MKQATSNLASQNIYVAPSRQAADFEGSVVRRMPANSRATRVLLFSVLSLFVVGPALGQAGKQVADKSPQSANASAASAHGTEAGKYVGAETCKSCHGEIYNAWAKTPHWKLPH